jgi:hypothetical protein
VDLERALADVFGGFDGGWPFWLAGLAQLGLALERSRDREGAFTSYPAGELRRLSYDLENALTLLELAAGVQDLLNGDGSRDHRGELVGLLERRVRETAAAATLDGDAAGPPQAPKPPGRSARTKRR